MVYMHTTKIDPKKTAMEIQSLLLDAGATDILIQAELGTIKGISFRINTAHGHLPFVLPAEVERVLVILKRDHEPRYHTLAQAQRTGWRLILRWVEAQLALIETGMVTIDQIMLPFLEVDNGSRSLYEKMVDEGFLLALPSGD
jgi:hypothetical protein